MRASLVSATSLLALLLVDEGLSYASTITVSSPNLTEYFLLNGVGSISGSELITVSGATGTSTMTIAPATQDGLTVSPTSTTITSNPQTVNATATFYFSSLTAASYSSPFTTSDAAGTGTDTANFTRTASAISASSVLNIPVGNTGTAAITAGNIGNGNLYGKTEAGAVGTIGFASSVFTGSSKSFTMNDTNYGAGSVTSAPQIFTYTPTMRGNSSATVVTSLASGSNTRNQTSSVSTIPTVNGVAPVGAQSTSSTNYFLVGQTRTATVTASNSGDGNLSGLGATSNFRGRPAAASSGFSGTGQSISRGDTSSTGYSYTFAPTVRSPTASALVVASLSNGSANGTNAAFVQNVSLTGTGVTPVRSVSSAGSTNVRVGTSGTVTTDNIGNGNLATGGISNAASNLSLASGVTGPGAGTSVSVPHARSTALAYTYASRSGSITNISTPTASPNGSVGAAGAAISFGTLTDNQSQTVYLALKNISTDPGGAPTNLTIENYSIAGTGANEFHPSLIAGTLISEGGQLLLPLTVIATGDNAFNSPLTIFSGESAALGGTGDTFTYALTAFAAVPEPATMAAVGAVLGAGLAGLAGIRRRRKQAGKP